MEADGEAVTDVWRKEKSARRGRHSHIWGGTAKTNADFEATWVAYETREKLIPGVPSEYRNLRKTVFWVARRKPRCSKISAPQQTPHPMSAGKKKTHAAAATMRFGHGAAAGDEVGKRPLELISSL